MSVTPRALEPRCAWLAAEVADEEVWTEHLTPDELAELDHALRHALASTDDLVAIGRDEFPLPGLSTRLRSIEEELIDGRGFVRIRGIDRAAHSQAEMEIFYWGIGIHLGHPWAQNHHGHVLGDVTDQAKALDDPTARGNELGGIALPFHCDGADLVGLLCLANGSGGGRSAVANLVTIHNRLVEEHPDLAAALYEDYPYDFRGEQPPACPPTTSCRCSPSGTTGSSPGSSRPTSRHPNATPRHRACPRCSGRRWRGSSPWPRIPPTT